MAFFPRAWWCSRDSGARSFLPANGHCCWEIKQYIPPASLGSQPPGSLLVPVALLARMPLASAVLTQADLSPGACVCSLDGYWVLSARTWAEGLCSVVGLLPGGVLWLQCHENSKGGGGHTDRFLTGPYLYNSHSLSFKEKKSAKLCQKPT